MTENRKGYKTIEEQMEANKRWREKNKERSRYLSLRSSAKSFIRNKATLEDLEELRELMEIRKDSLFND